MMTYLNRWSSTGVATVIIPKGCLSGTLLLRQIFFLG
jgi:hypothetical protein